MWLRSNQTYMHMPLIVVIWTLYIVHQAPRNYHTWGIGCLMNHQKSYKQSGSLDYHATFRRQAKLISYYMIWHLSVSERDKSCRIISRKSLLPIKPLFWMVASNYASLSSNVQILLILIMIFTLNLLVTFRDCLLINFVFPSWQVMYTATYIHISSTYIIHVVINIRLEFYSAITLSITTLQIYHMIPESSSYFSNVQSTRVYHLLSMKDICGRNM